MCQLSSVENLMMDGHGGVCVRVSGHVSCQGTEREKERVGGKGEEMETGVPQSLLRTCSQ
jgi:hypothetical protein